MTPVNIEQTVANLSAHGYWVSFVPVRDGPVARDILEVAHSLGDVFIPGGCDSAEPVIRTSPTRGANAAPFDRPEPIGWHADFATHEHRPELSIVHVIRRDPKGGMHGAWRLASVARVIEALAANAQGRVAIELLSERSLPFSYSEGEAPRRFHVLECRPNGRIGMRFYQPSIRRGCMAEFGAVPLDVGAALAALERAADEVAQVVPTTEGSLLITSNWFALHDRMEQSVDSHGRNREALLCFVAWPRVGLDRTDV